MSLLAMISKNTVILVSLIIIVLLTVDVVGLRGSVEEDWEWSSAIADDVEALGRAYRIVRISTRI